MDEALLPITLKPFAQYKDCVKFTPFYPHWLGKYWKIIFFPNRLKQETQSVLMSIT